MVSADEVAIDEVNIQLHIYLGRKLPQPGPAALKKHSKGLKQTISSRHCLHQRSEGILLVVIR